MSELESGKKKDISSTLAKLMAFELGCSYEWLIHGDVKPFIGDKLMRARTHNRNKLALEQAANTFAVPQKLLLKIEAGEIAPSEDLLNKMCALYGVNKYQVLDEKAKLTPAGRSTGDDTLDMMVLEYREVLDLLRKNPEQKERITDFLKGIEAKRQMGDELNK